MKARTLEELATQLTSDPDWNKLSQSEQDAVFNELAKDIEPSRPVPFMLLIPDYMKIVVPSQTTSVGGFVNVVGLIGVTIFCLALYFPLVRSMVDLFKRRRSVKK